MRESIGEYSYVEPPLSQLEIPYKMHFSSSDDDKDKRKSKKRNKAKQKALNKMNTRKRKYDSSSSSDSDSSSSSSSCGSFDSNPDRKVTNREPLRVNDIISYTPSVFTMGTNVKQAVVLGIWPSEKSFPLILDTADMLPWDTHIQRIAEFYDGQIYKHPGRIKQLSSFRLYQGGTQDVTVGMKKQASNFKQMFHDMQQRAMATLRGEVNSPPRSQSPGLNSEKPKVRRMAVSSSSTNGSNLSNTKYRKQEKDSASTSSDSSTSLSPVRKGRGKQNNKSTFSLARKPAAIKNSKQTTELLPELSKSTESSEDSSSSSSNDDSLPLEKLAVKKPRGYRSKRLSLTKTNSLASATSPLHWGRSKPKTKPKQPPSTKEVIKKANKSSPRSPKNYLIDVDSSDDSLLPKGKGKKPDASKKKRVNAFPPTSITTLNEGSDSDNEDGPSPKGILPKHIQHKLQNHRTARRSLPKCDTMLWSGSDDESDELTAGIDKTLERRKKRRKLLNEKDTLANLNASKPKSKSRSTGLPLPRIPKAKTYSNKKLHIGSSSSDNSIEKKSETAKKNKLTKLPQGRITNAMLGLGSEDSSDDDDEDLLLKTPAVAKRNTRKQSPKKKKQVLSNTTTQKKKSTAPCYDADEDSENDDSLLAKPVWFHNHSSERKVKSPSPSKSRNKCRPATSSDRKAFPKSPGNGSRSRLVQDIRRGKMLFSSPSPTPRKVSKQPPKQYELSPSSNDTSSESDIYFKTSGRAKKTRSDWSSDCSVDSPPEAAFIPSPSPKKKKKTTRTVSKRIKS